MTYLIVSRVLHAARLLGRSKQRNAVLPPYSRFPPVNAGSMSASSSSPDELVRSPNEPSDASQVPSDASGMSDASVMSDKSIVTENSFRRIDRPHAEASSHPAKSASIPSPSSRPTIRQSNSVAQLSTPLSPAKHQVAEQRNACDDFAPQESWLRLHAADLIARLSTWSNDLDSREATLNARVAKQDLRERQFRLLQHDAQIEMDEQQRAIERLRAQMENQARRLAFQS